MKTLSLATILSKQNPALINTDDEYLVLSPFEDEELEAKSKVCFIKYEVDTLAFVLAMMCAKVFNDDTRFMDIDDGYLSGESNVGDEEIDEIIEFLKACERVIVAPEIFKQTNGASLEFMLGLLCSHFKLKCVDLNANNIELKGELSELEDSGDFNGACVFYYNAKANELLGSALFANVAKLKDGAQITLKTNFGEIPTTFRIDKTLKGTIALFAHPSAQNYFEKLKLA